MFPDLRPHFVDLRHRETCSASSKTELNFSVRRQFEIQPRINADERESEEQLKNSAAATLLGPWTPLLHDLQFYFLFPDSRSSALIRD